MTDMRTEKEIMRHFLRLFLLGAALFSMAGTSTASDRGLLAILGGQRVGTSSMTFLKIPVGARAEAMGGAYVALANDAFAAFWNPAGIAQVSNRWHGKYSIDGMKLPDSVKGPVSDPMAGVHGVRSVGFVHMQWVADINYNAVSLIQPLPTGVLGLSLASLTTPDMEITTEYHPDGIGQYFSYGDALLGLSYSMAMTDNFSWGISLKYARETLADTYMQNVLLDLGTYYWTGFRDLRIGVSLVNFGANSRPEGSYTVFDENGKPENKQYKAYSPPTEFRLGGAMTLYTLGPHKFITSLQLNHPVDNSENIKLGGEYGFMNMLFLRGGLKFNTDEDRWVVGAGVNVPWRNLAVGVDYSYTDFGILDKSQRLSVTILF